MFSPLCLVFLLLALAQVAFAEPPVGAASPFNYYTERLAPCGSPLGSGERVVLPTKSARVAFFAERDVGLNLAISYSQDPAFQEDFESLKYSIAAGPVDLVSGITCIILGTPIPGAAHGRNATLQLKYLSNYDSPNHYRYRYSCADIVFSDKVDNSNGDICRNKTRSVAYDRLDPGMFLDEPVDEEQDDHEQPPPPPPSDMGNYVQVKVDGPPFPSWGVALIVVGVSWFLLASGLLFWKFVAEPRRKRINAQKAPWVPPPV
ncbi:hypothetical protein BBK36DRAFT_1110677 [Trichoderma citrinoviride]|uniref:Copper acquisition factor BIM1-like domain-containing protein n=1 Tax=Trichoderma citrinoviride TaxID=58853 RepID=A0A2T4BJM0_9HYPO|nr:hypothetical protein BBK36DRAFT_1110677 [Trichoderma citrinoviride]PTB69498.1 hypothetical protein BBK36DRAFT_1110677 [Trichoderma citrinoviride]